MFAVRYIAATISDLKQEAMWLQIDILASFQTIQTPLKNHND